MVHSTLPEDLARDLIGFPCQAPLPMCWRDQTLPVWPAVHLPSARHRSIELLTQKLRDGFRDRRLRIAASSTALRTEPAPTPTPAIYAGAAAVAASAQRLPTPPPRRFRRSRPEPHWQRPH